MENPVLQLRRTPEGARRRSDLRTAIRQLERADLYLAAAYYVGLGDPPAERLLVSLRADLEGLRRRLVDLRAEPGE